MEWIKPNTHFDFVGKMKPALACSTVLIVLTIVSLIWHGGLNFGIDFAGGTLIQIKFQREASPDRIRSAFRAVGLNDSVIQQIGENEVVVRTAATQSGMRGLSDRIATSLEAIEGKGTFEIRRVEVVGPKVGKDLTKKAILALIFSWVGMLIYIAWRFEFRYALGGILALVHDTVISVGALSILDKEFTLTIVAALLTIVGYSINDTIVVFDRIHENARKNVKQPLSEVINASINETLSRTILTAFTVFLVLLTLFFLGGAVIHDFAYVLLVGVVIGTYSSIFIASPIVLLFEKVKPSGSRRKSR